MRRAPLLAALAALALCGQGLAQEREPGDDIARAFKKAQAGAPLRAVALGGSITQNGNGWIGPWLQEKLPGSRVGMVNAGMSATGSELALYRLERDVVANQPDLVLFEFSVNDGGERERVLWSAESVIRRLKSLPDPPAILVLEAASRRRPDDAVPPQRELAAHYGLLSVNLQAALKRRLAESGGRWEDYLGDDVHPNRNGDAFYAETIAKELEPLLAKAAKGLALERPALPPQLSKRTLVTNGKLMAIAPSGKWRKAHATPGWWNMFFLGNVACEEGGQPLTLSFKGTSCALFYAMDERYGLLYASVDGGPCKTIVTNSRKGYSYASLADDLAPGEHLLTLSLPLDAAGEEGVKLGYLMAGGEEAGPLAPQGPWTPERIAALKEGVAASGAWLWCGPFGDCSTRWPADAGGLPDMKEPFWPEPAEGSASPKLKAPEGDIYAKLAWKPCDGSSTLADLRKLSGFGDRGVAYLWTSAESAKAQKVECLMTLDYYCKIWINGKLANETLAHHGNPATPVKIELPFEAGRNEILVKVQSGSAGFLFGLRAPAPEAKLAFKRPDL